MILRQQGGLVIGETGTRSRVWSSQELVWIHQPAIYPVTGSLSKKTYPLKPPHWFRASAKCLKRKCTVTSRQFFYLFLYYLWERTNFSWYYGTQNVVSNFLEHIRQVPHQCLPSRSGTLPPTAAVFTQTPSCFFGTCHVFVFYFFFCKLEYFVLTDWRNEIKKAFRAISVGMGTQPRLTLPSWNPLNLSSV